MARTRTIAERNYQAGLYGPFTVDSFNSTNVTRIRLQFTRVAWPAVDALAKLVIRWNTGGATECVISGHPPDDGETFAEVDISIPDAAAGKRAVTSATATLEVYQAFRSAIEVRAI